MVRNKMWIGAVCSLLMLSTACSTHAERYVLASVPLNDVSFDFSDIAFSSYAEGQIILDLLNPIDNFHHNVQSVAVSDVDFSVRNIEMPNTMSPFCLNGDNVYSYSETSHSLVQKNLQTEQEDVFFVFPNDTQIIGNYTVRDDYIIWIEGDENRENWTIKKYDIAADSISTLAETNYLDNDFYTDLDIIDDWFAYAQVNGSKIVFKAVNIMTGQEMQHSIERTQMLPENIECNGDVLLWCSKIGKQYHGYCYRFGDDTTITYHEDITDFALLDDSLIAYSSLNDSRQMEVYLYSMEKQQVIQQFDELKFSNYIREFAADDTHTKVAIVAVDSQSRNDSLLVLKPQL